MTNHGTSMKRWLSLKQYYLASISKGPCTSLCRTGSSSYSEAPDRICKNIYDRGKILRLRTQIKGTSHQQFSKVLTSRDVSGPMFDPNIDTVM
jgi:hypothetical protein